MGQATSRRFTTTGHANVFYNYDDFSNRVAHVGLSALAMPMVVIAFPVLNAYTFTEEELTGWKLVDGVIGGLLGVIGWPLAPFLACWSMFQVLFQDGPPQPVPIPQELKDQARRTMGLNCEQFYNVAVVGVAGTGKSTIVNGIMGYHDTHTHAAKTGEVEATAKPTAYRHPDLRTMIIWDMPGAGTMNHPADTYFEDKFLFAFDTLVIVTAERLQEFDLCIAIKAQEYRIPVLFVRNKADQAVNAKIRRYNGKQDDDTYAWAQAVGELVKEVKHSIYKQLGQNHLSTRRLFIISGWHLQEFVSLLSTQQSHEHNRLRLIDEQRFMRTLVEGVLMKRQQQQKRKRNQ